MAVIYRVNMSDLSVVAEQPPEQYAGLGGRGMTSALVADEVPPTCHPLSAENKLVIAPGILTGTGPLCRPVVGRGQEPADGHDQGSNSGGMGALALAALRHQGDRARRQAREKQFYRLVVNGDGVKIEAAERSGRAGQLRHGGQQFESSSATRWPASSIGQAGEMRCSAASIAVTDVEGRPTRHCGRGGLGAVMGSKGVKVIVVDPAGGQRPSRPTREAFKAASRNSPNRSATTR